MAQEDQLLRSGTGVLVVGEVGEVHWDVKMASFGAGRNHMKRHSASQICTGPASKIVA